MDLTPETTARDEHEPLTTLRVLVGELHGHTTTERVPDDRPALLAERFEKMRTSSAYAPRE